MDKSEPTFVPEWLKSSGGLSTTSNQLTSSSLNTDEQGASKSVRNKSLDNELGRPLTSSYLRRTSSISNGSSHLRSYSSFSRNHRDRDWDKRDYSDPLGNILLSRFEKDGLKRSHSSLSGKRGSHFSGGGSGSGVKTLSERDFPSLGADEKQADSDIGRVPSPGMISAIQSLPISGSDGWTSALAEVPVAQPVQPTSISATTSMAGGRNMAETLAHGPPRTQTASQVTVGTQRLEELAVKQSRQLIPMTPSMPKALAFNSSDKLKLKVGQSQPRPVSVKSDVPKTSSGGKLLVLKPSRERNGISPTAKESLSPTSGTKLPNSPLSVSSAVTSVERKPSVATVEKRPSSQAQSRNNFFNLMRKKSMMSCTDSPSSEKPGEPVAPQGGSESNTSVVNPKVDLTGSTAINGKNHSGPDAILYSEEEEARFLRSLGWDETAEEEEGLTEEEISSFYRNYLNLKPKLMMPINLPVSSDSKLEG